jgi:hypothetical protein
VGQVELQEFNRLRCTIKNGTQQINAGRRWVSSLNPPLSAGIQLQLLCCNIPDQKHDVSGVLLVAALVHFRMAYANTTVRFS